MTAIALFVTLGLLAALAIMQLLLIFGVPIGHYAWGGKSRVLPPRGRVAAGVAIALYALFAAVVLSRAGVWPGGESLLIVISAWVLFAYVVFSILPNLASKSRPERAAQTPVSVLLSISIGLIASGVLG